MAKWVKTSGLFSVVRVSEGCVGLRQIGREVERGGKVTPQVSYPGG